MLKILFYKILILLLSFNLLDKQVIAAESNEPKITFNKINDNFWVLHGGNGLGANAGLSIGKDGLVLIDAMNVNTGQKLIEAIRTISDKPIKYVINTHQHRDHRGGNEDLVALGATIIYPDFLKYQIGGSTAYSGVDREIQFSNMLSLKLNDEIFDLYHVKSHTWNDVIVHLRNNDAIFTGDNHATSWGPNIGALGLKGHRRIFDLVLSLANEKTLIVPGHNELADLKQFRDFDSKTQEWFEYILAQFHAGKTAEQIAKDEKIANLLRWFHNGQFPSWLNEARLIGKIKSTINSDESKVLTLTLDEQQKYIGRYQLDDTSFVEIFSHQNNLFAFKEKSFMAYLLPGAENRLDFSGSDEKERFEFEWDKSGKVLTLNFLVNDTIEYVAKKVE